MLNVQIGNNGWKQLDTNKSTKCFFKGCQHTAKQLVELLANEPAQTLGAAIKQVLNASQEFHVGLVESDDYVIGWVDHIRSAPVFYAAKANDFYISPIAEDVRKRAELNVRDTASICEFSMSGYITGKHSVFQELYALQPGEFLIWNKGAKTLEVDRYYRYLPNLSAQSKWDIDTFGKIIDRLMIDILKRADGRTIWVPLSAGLDSRLILCKLHEHGYKKLQTFSYGPRMNFELIHARKIARTLDLPWRHIAPPPWVLRRYFNSNERKEYWDYASQYKAVPCMREYSALKWLQENNIADKNDIFINGQSGDYITGGHIHKDYLSAGATNLDVFYRNIIEKHYACWKKLLTTENTEVVRKRIEALVGEQISDMGSSNLERAAQEEAWEYDARQACLVVNGQRSYEFFEYQWEMPLWAKPLCDFCETLSIEEKANQALYKKYLQNYNYRGLFPKQEPHLWRWPVYMLWVPVIAKVLEFLCGEKAKRHFYALMRYFGHYSNQYWFLPFSKHFKSFRDSRNVVSLYIERWLADL